MECFSDILFSDATGTILRQRRRENEIRLGVGAFGFSRNRKTDTGRVAACVRDLQKIGREGGEIMITVNDGLVSILKDGFVLKIAASFIEFEINEKSFMFNFANCSFQVTNVNDYSSTCNGSFWNLAEWGYESGGTSVSLKSTDATPALQSYKVTIISKFEPIAMFEVVKYLDCLTIIDC